MDMRPRSNHAFHRAARRWADTSALIIDVQLGTISKMEPDDARAYLQYLGKSIDRLRAKYVGLTWVTVGDQDQVFQPEAHAGRMGKSMLVERGFLDSRGRPTQANENYGLFIDFLSRHGPHRNDLVCAKTTMDSFGTKVLADQLKFQGTQNLAVLGAVSSRCVLESAIGAAHHLLKPTILTDEVLSWTGEEQASPLGWRGPDHETIIRAAVTDFQRAYSPTQLAEASTIRFSTFDDMFEGARRPPRMAPKGAENRLEK